MMGTSFSQTLEMERTPPKMTAATSTTITRPTAQAGTGSDEVMMPVMAEACTAEPVPMVATTAKAAKATAPSLAHQGTVPSARLKARSHTYMAPPSMLPLWSRTR